MVPRHAAIDDVPIPDTERLFHRKDRALPTILTWTNVLCEGGKRATDAIT